MKNNIFKSRRFKHGSLATIITIGFIVVLVLINVVFGMLSERFPMQIDLTADKRFELTDDSVNFVKGLEDDVNITVCASEATFENAGSIYKQAYEIIKNYEKHSSKVHLDFVDLQREPLFAQKYPGEDIVLGDIIVETSKRMRIVKSSSFFSQTQSAYGTTVYSSEAEQVMTSAIMYVTDEHPTKAVFLTGLNNADVSGLRSILESNNYQIVEQNLQTEEIDSEAEIIVLPQPSVDITADMAKKLEAYLDNNAEFGKSLIFVASTVSGTSEIGPVLKNFLAEWGIEIGNEVIVESNTANAVQNAYNVVNVLADEEFNKLLKGTNLPLLTPSARPVWTLFEEKDNRMTRVIAKTSPTAFLQRLDEDDVTDLIYDSFNTIVIGSRQRINDNEQKLSNVLAIGSQLMTSENYVKYAGCTNGEVLVAAANDLTKKEDAVKILPVEFSNKTISITEKTYKMYSNIFVWIIPILVLAAGTVVWLRRRHK